MYAICVVESKAWIKPMHPKSGWRGCCVQTGRIGLVLRLLPAWPQSLRLLLLQSTTTVLPRPARLVRLASTDYFARIVKFHPLHHKIIATSMCRMRLGAESTTGAWSCSLGPRVHADITEGNPIRSAKVEYCTVVLYWHYQIATRVKLQQLTIKLVTFWAVAYP